jgi:transaldolase
MKPTQALHQLGQSLWLDNITRDMLRSGVLARYIGELSLTGLTSNPTIFHQAISKSSAYDADIAQERAAGRSSEDAFFTLALADIVAAADLFRPVHDRTCGVDGWVSLEVPPDIAYDTERTIDVARTLHARAARPNVYIKIPGTPEGLPAIEAATAAGVPVNVTLLFSREQYVAAAEAYLRGIERRIAAGERPDVSSVASLFVSRWDVAVAEQVPASLVNRLGIAVAASAYRAYRELLDSPRWQRAFNFGARAQRLLMASTGVKDPQAEATLYVSALAAPHTVNTMPESTLLAFAERGSVGAALARDGGDSEAVLAQFRAAGLDLNALAAKLQRDGARAFVDSWGQLLDVIGAKMRA